MTIATLTQFKDILANESVPETISVASTTVIAGRPFDLWVSTPPVGVAPTTAAAPNRTTVGALGQQNSTTGTLAVIAARFSSISAGQYMVCDRLSHQGGLSGIVTTAQTTNLPTAALTRHTSGTGVMMALTIYTAVGATGTTVTVSYTNDAGTAGRVTEPVVFGGTGFREAGRLIMLPLQSGDTGVRSVQSVTVLATTATAGAFGVTLFKPLFAILVPDTNGVLPAAGYITGSTFGGIPEVIDDACLFLTTICASTNPMGAGALLLGEH